ncbi:MAG: SURF1 family protein [Paracoccus sp. (in: a-proteobacteria)]|nr:SURF1 family protein [Paracoccus sp. (in: a-proteobacteria)]
MGRPLWQVGLVLLAGAGLFALFLGLGLWQVERLSWKRDLIARVDARVHAAPIPWAEAARMPPDLAEYRHVTLTGRFDHTRETLVQALTELGGGFWVLTPLETADGAVLVNRGFVPPGYRDPARRAPGQIAGEVTLTGLLRLSEPGGGFLRRNDPEGGRWFSRDTAAIAKARGISAAPCFMDADARPNPGGWPLGGLTVIAFRNTHLSYALTWFILAAMMAGGMVILIRHELRTRRAASG